MSGCITTYGDLIGVSWGIVNYDDMMGYKWDITSLIWFIRDGHPSHDEKTCIQNSWQRVDEHPALWQHNAVYNQLLTKARLVLSGKKCSQKWGYHCVNQFNGVSHQQSDLRVGVVKYWTNLHQGVEYPASGSFQQISRPKRLFCVERRWSFFVF